MEESINRAVQHPTHYCQYDVEVLTMMERIWGKEEVKTFCKLNAFKYRMRAGHKDDVAQDLQKEEFYLNYINELEREEMKELSAQEKLNAIKEVMDNTCNLKAIFDDVANILKQ